MKYSVVESFTINSKNGPIVFPVGKLLELTEEQAAKLKGKIQSADAPAVPPLECDIVKVTHRHVYFEQSGDPVSCPNWFRVCWAVGMYQKQCTRSSDCTVYKFLKRQDEASNQISAIPNIDTNPPF